MQTLLPSSCCSPTRLHLLLSVLFFLTLLSPGQRINVRPLRGARKTVRQTTHAAVSVTSLPLPCVRSGMGPAQNHCINLGGTCRRDICRTTEDIIAYCKRRWKCCRSWWILIPVPTPAIYSDYVDHVKPKIK